jgi:hypothetical protein
MRIAAALVALAPLAARADELVVKTHGSIASNLELRVEDKSTGDYFDRHALPAGPEWAQGLLSFGVDASFGNYKGVADLDVVLNGFADDVNGVRDLARLEHVDPVRIEVRQLFVEAKGLGLKGLDLRVGQQVIAWGVGDQFNPTNNLSPDDLRDRLLFGKLAGNFMVRVDYWLAEDLSVTGVVVPIFKPALLPRSAPIGIGAVDRLPFASDFLRWRVEAEQAASATLGVPTVVEAAVPNLPDPTLDNMAETLRIAGSLGGQDIALSYYRGRTDFPVPYANHTRYDPTQAQCDPNDSSRCVKGLLETTVQLGYPHMQVFGLNVAGEIPLDWISDGARGLGYRLEAAVILPQQATIALTNDALPIPGAPAQPAGEYDYDGDGTPGGPHPVVVDDQAFAKWAAGLDYTFGEHVYVNAQWVHGFPDEYGTGRAIRASGVTTSAGETLVGCALVKDGTTCAREVYRPAVADYAVLGVDFKLLNNALLVRLFNILDLSGMTEESYDDAAGARVQRSHSPFSSEGFSMVVYPEVEYNFGNGLELGGGALLMLGSHETKFGDPAAGGSLVWGRAKMSF